MASYFTGLAIEVEKKHALFRPKTMLNGISVEGYSSPYGEVTDINNYPATFTAAGIPKSFGNWGYTLLPPPNLQIQSYLGSEELTYSELVDLIALTSELSALTTNPISELELYV